MRLLGASGKNNVIMMLWGVVHCLTLCDRQADNCTLLYDTFYVENSVTFGDIYCWQCEEIDRYFAINLMW